MHRRFMASLYDSFLLQSLYNVSAPHIYRKLVFIIDAIKYLWFRCRLLGMCYYTVLLQTTQGDDLVNTVLLQNTQYTVLLQIPRRWFGIYSTAAEYSIYYTVLLQSTQYCNLVYTCTVLCILLSIQCHCRLLM